MVIDFIRQMGLCVFIGVVVFPLVLCNGFPLWSFPAVLVTIPYIYSLFRCITLIFLFRYCDFSAVNLFLLLFKYSNLTFCITLFQRLPSCSIFLFLLLCSDFFLFLYSFFHVTLLRIFFPLLYSSFPVTLFWVFSLLLYSSFPITLPPLFFSLLYSSSPITVTTFFRHFIPHFLLLFQFFSPLLYFSFLVTLLRLFFYFFTSTFFPSL